MKQTQNTNSGSGVYKRDNEYTLTRRDMSTPYFKAYCAAKAQQPSGGKVKMSPVYGGAQRSSYVENDYSESVSASRRSTGGSAKKARRGFFVALVAVFMLLYIAVLVLNYVNLEALGDYNQYLSLFNKVEAVEAAEGEGEDDEEEVAEAAAEDADEDEAADADEESDEDVATETKIKQTIGVEDILMSFIASFVNDKDAPADEEDDVDVDADEEDPDEEVKAPIDTSNYAFYNDCLKDMENAETLNKIAYYALPISLVLGALIAIIFFIRALVALFTNKRRKLFVTTSIILLVLNIVGILCGFIWSGAEWSNIMAFTPFGNGSIEMQVGYGYLILTGLSLLTLIASLFAFRSKKSLS